MPDSDPLGCFSSMPNGPFLSSPHKTDILTGEPGCISSHLRSAAGPVICFVVIIYLISLSIDLANGPTFSGRAGTDHHSNHEDRDARPVRCNGWLCPPHRRTNRGPAEDDGPGGQGADDEPKSE